jgi:hypothetical protein
MLAAPKKETAATDAATALSREKAKGKSREKAKGKRKRKGKREKGMRVPFSLLP